MYKYHITLTDKSLVIATSPYSLIFTIAEELTKREELFLHIGDAIVRKPLIESVKEVKIDE